MQVLTPLSQDQANKHQNYLQKAQEKCSLSQADVLGLGRGARLFHFEDQVPKFQIHPQLGNPWEGTVCGTRADIQTASLTVDSTLPMLSWNSVLLFRHDLLLICVLSFDASFIGLL